MAEAQLCVTFMDDSERYFPTGEIQGGWTIRNFRGVPFLIVGHGVPRYEIPLSNVRFFEIQPVGRS